MQAIRAYILHDHNSWFRSVGQQIIQLLEAYALAALGGAIYCAGDSIADSGRQFRKDAADIGANVSCNTRAHLERFDSVGDCRTINAAQCAKLLKAELGNHGIFSLSGSPSPIDDQR